MIDVYNPPPTSEEYITFAEAKVGKLYYILGFEKTTVYMKSLSGDIVWFEVGKDRMNCMNDAKFSTIKEEYMTKRKFVEAPQGTFVTIMQWERE